jgi:ATP-binding cassette, subfamily B, bacterial
MDIAAAPRKVVGSPEWQLLFSAIWKASSGLAAAWWSLIVLRALLPTGFAISIGAVVDAISGGWSLQVPIIALAVVFLGLQVLGPLHAELGTVLGLRASGWLHGELAAAAARPAGVAHLEDAELMDDFKLARDFDLGMTGPTLAECMSYLGGALAQFGGGVVAIAALFQYRWWAGAAVAVAWLSPQVLLREHSAWRDWRADEMKRLQRHADYAFDLATKTPAAKELRLFGLEEWAVRRYVRHRRALLAITIEAIRLREPTLIWAMTLTVGITFGVTWSLVDDVGQGNLALGAALAFIWLIVTASTVADLDFAWWLRTAAEPVPLARGLQQRMAAVGGLPTATGGAAVTATRSIRLRDVTFRYPGCTAPVLAGLDLDIPVGRSLAIVGQNGAGKTTLVKLLCRLYDPQAGAVEVDGTDLRSVDIEQWRGRVAAVFQDYVRYEWTLRDNVALGGADDAHVRASLSAVGAADVAPLDTVLSKAYEGGADLSGGQWQRVAIARALCAVKEGAELVVLDEPTAQLDVRGETEVFNRILAETRGCTTVLISHRFSTVRRADLIAVLDGGRVVEQGSHEELMALRGRYHLMFTRQAARFVEGDDAGEY